MSVLVRHLSEFPTVAARLSALIGQLGLATVPPKSFVLYGSVVRSIWTGETPGDFNIDFLDGDVYGACQPMLKLQPMMAATLKQYESPRAIIGAADFTVCQLAFHDGHLVHSAHYFEHLAQRMLVLNRLEPKLATGTFLRTFKYTQRGYGITYSELLRIINAIPSGVQTMMPSQIMRQSGGTIL